MIYWGLVIKLNIFLQINKKILLIIIFFLGLLISISLITYIKIKKTVENKIDIPIFMAENNDYDILKPKFTINNEKEIISVTANEGDIMENNDILLKNNVLFKSKEFSIYSDNVTYNRDMQTADSKNKSIFISKKTKITSEGFNIIEQGKIIKFNGKSTIILSKWK